jgi:hypothetical protein
MSSQRIKCFGKCYEIARYEFGSLMNQLVEGVLTVRSRFAPVDWRRFICDFGAVKRDVLAVALHRQLLQIRGEPLQILFIR